MANLRYPLKFEIKKDMANTQNMLPIEVDVYLNIQTLSQSQVNPHVFAALQQISPAKSQNN